jgi:hypothetical protein
MTTQVSTKGRQVSPGCNCVWHITDTREDAIAWFFEITGTKPTYDWLISEMNDGRYGFRIHIR